MSRVSGSRFAVSLPRIRVASAFGGQVSGFRCPVDALCRPSSVFPLLFSVFFLALTARAQDIPRGMTSSAGFGDNASQGSSGTREDVATDSPKVDASEEWEQELLRDPFWPVDYFPPNWKSKSDVQGSSDLGSSGWDAAKLKLKISGTSGLGGRTAAIINGELKSEGDTLEVQHEGRTYQWKIVGIDAAGQIQLKKFGIK
jgi:hypothetical protein